MRKVVRGVEGRTAGLRAVHDAISDGDESSSRFAEVEFERPLAPGGEGFGDHQGRPALGAD